MPINPDLVYPDAATLIIDWAKDTLGLANACHEVPTNLAQCLANGPVHVIERIGGAEKLPGVDVPRLAVDTFGMGRAGTLADAERLRKRLALLQGTAIGGVAVSKVATISAPTKRRFDSRTIVLVTASYQLTLHSRY